MRSIEPSSWRPPPAPGIAGYAAPARVTPVRPVWVLLDQVFRHDPAAFRSVPDGLELCGRARGFLSDWRRGSRGEWVGMVNYELRYADGREATVWLQDQMVPGYALRPRAAD